MHELVTPGRDASAQRADYGVSFKQDNLLRQPFRPREILTHARLWGYMAGRTLRVGIDNAPPAPMQLGTPEGGDFRGYEVDLLREVARRTGFELSFRRALWSVIVGELGVGEVDVVCSAATITAERERDVDFCLPHLQLTLAVVTRGGRAADIALDGLRIGVRRGTTAEAFARERRLLQPAQVSESNVELYAALAAGELDAVIDDSPIAKYFSRAVAGLHFAGALPRTAGAYAIMVRKGNHALRAEINQALAEIENDGTRRRLLAQWFGDGYREAK